MFLSFGSELFLAKSEICRVQRVSSICKEMFYDPICLSPNGSQSQVTG